MVLVFHSTVVTSVQQCQIFTPLPIRASNNISFSLPCRYERPAMSGCHSIAYTSVHQCQFFTPLPIRASSNVNFSLPCRYERPAMPVFHSLVDASDHPKSVFHSLVATSIQQNQYSITMSIRAFDNVQGVCEWSLNLRTPPSPLHACFKKGVTGFCAL